MYLTELLQDVLEYQPARDQVAAAALDFDGDRLGASLRGQVRAHLDGLDPETLSRMLITGLTRDEFPDGRGAVYQLGAQPGAGDLRPSPHVHREQAAVPAGPGSAGRRGRAAAGPGRDRDRHRRHVATSARLEQAGLEVTRVPGSELGSARGGPRSLTCPVTRDPVTSGPGAPIRAGA
jgi:arginine deiminase